MHDGQERVGEEKKKMREHALNKIKQVNGKKEGIRREKKIGHCDGQERVKEGKKQEVSCLRLDKTSYRLEKAERVKERGQGNEMESKTDKGRETGVKIGNVCLIC